MSFSTSPKQLLSHSALSQYDQAIDYYTQSIRVFKQIQERKGEAHALMNLGNTYRMQSQYDKAMSSYQKALPVFYEVGDREGQVLIFSNIGQLLLKQNKIQLAIVFFKASINIREDIRGDIQSLSLELQQSYIDAVASDYRLLAELLISEGRFLESLQVLELLKAEEIREYTRGTVTNIQTGDIKLSPVETDIINKHDSIVQLGLKIDDCEAAVRSCSEEERLNWYRDRTTLTTEWNTLITSLERAVSPVAPNPRDLITEGVSEVLEAQPNTVLIYPVVLKDRLVLLWATRGGVANAIEVPQVTESDINRAAFEFRRLMRQCEISGCTAEDIPTIQSVAQQLHQWLLPKDLDDLLRQEGIENLVFALDQQLRYIPMAALHNGNQYLIERYTLSTVTAAWLTPTANPLPINPADVSVLALGLSDEVPDNDLTDDVPYFAPLKHVANELDGIVRSSSNTNDLTGVYSGTNLLNKDFDDSAFYRLKFDDHQILHIATHGLFVPTNLYSSFLMLGTREDWRISEMQNVGQQFADLSLVVLSACETALGGNQQSSSETEDLDGREISGIAQTFLDAGADAIIASLWKVSDASTSALMQQFYLELAKRTEENPVTFSQALKRAQISLLTGNVDPAVAETLNRGLVNWGENSTETRNRASETIPDFSHPFYWAPFTLIGNGL